MDNLYIVCVIYNKKITDIRSLNNFFRLKENHSYIKIMIMDNSSEKYSSCNQKIWDREYKDEIIYLNNNGNVGLSKAYNKALDYIPEKKYTVMLSDDDTLFSDEYLENVIRALIKGKTDIICGVVWTNNIILSPAKKLAVIRRYSQKRYIKKPGIYNNIYPINSGLVVKSNVFDIVGKYDERIFLDAVDLLFSDKLINYGINRIEIVGGEIAQDYSVETNNLEAQKKRIKIFNHDWTMWWKIEHKHTFIVLISLFLANANVFKKFILSKLGLSK